MKRRHPAEIYCAFILLRPSNMHDEALRHLANYPVDDYIRRIDIQAGRLGSQAHHFALLADDIS